MKKYKTFVVKYRRKTSGKTDYRKRLKLLLGGKPRLVVRKSLKNITAQIAAYSKEGDKILASAHSRELNEFGWNSPKGNTPSAYLVGLLLGKKAKKTNIKEMILDLGMNKSVKGSRL